MSLDVMKQALAALELLARYENPATKIQIRKPRDGGSIVTMYPHKVAFEAATALRAAIEQAQPELEQAMTDAIIGGTGVMLGDKRIDPASIYKQPEQEPVAWQVMVEDEAMKEFPIKDMAHDWCAKKKLSGSPSAYWIRPLYTAPRQWQGLTDEEIKIIWRDIDGSEGMLMRFASAIEAKLKEKNT